MYGASDGTGRRIIHMAKNLTHYSKPARSRIPKIGQTFSRKALIRPDAEFAYKMIAKQNTKSPRCLGQAVQNPVGLWTTDLDIAIEAAWRT